MILELHLELMDGWFLHLWGHRIHAHLLVLAIDSSTPILVNDQIPVNY